MKVTVVPRRGLTHLLKELIHEVISVHLDNLLIVIAVLGLEHGGGKEGDSVKLCPRVTLVGVELCVHALSTWRPVYTPDNTAASIHGDRVFKLEGEEDRRVDVYYTRVENGEGGGGVGREVGPQPGVFSLRVLSSRSLQKGAHVLSE